MVAPTHIPRLIIVHGPPKSGKSTNATAIGKMLGCGMGIDDADEHVEIIPVTRQLAPIRCLLITDLPMMLLGQLRDLAYPVEFSDVIGLDTIKVLLGSRWIPSPATDGPVVIR